jgi:hypothetical protein
MASALIPFAIGTAASDVMVVFFGPAMPHFCTPDMAWAVGRTALLPLVFDRLGGAHPVRASGLLPWSPPSLTVFCPVRY